MWNKLISFCLLLLSYSAISQSNENELFDCYDSSQAEMNICSLEEYNYYDSILNVRYAELMNILNVRVKEYSKFEYDFEFKQVKTYKNAIIDSQRSWILKMRGLKN